MFHSIQVPVSQLETSVWYQGQRSFSMSMLRLTAELESRFNRRLDRARVPQPFRPDFKILCQPSLIISED
jgi:hypothetical protein